MAKRRSGELTLLLTSCPCDAVSGMTLTLGMECEFPEQWRGQWFQSGLGEVSITNDTVSTKGQCVNVHRDYYLLENK